jgi:hypothetical protein
MEQINENFIKELLNYQLPYVNGNVNFWMVRTKKGYFYDEYINDSYVALGWNIIDLSTDIGSIEKEQLEVLKENIKNIYGDKRPGQAISKCKKFMYELKIGDIIMIPGIHDDKIAFAEVGEYYEREDLNEENEIEVTTQIDMENIPVYSVECPYKKRRKIKVIKVINYKDLHVKLLKVLSSYQGICNLNEYGKYILDMIYPIYYWREAYSFQMHINTSKPIDLTSITKVMQCVDCYMKKVVGDNELSIMLNLNSKGVISFTSGKRNLDKTYNAKKDEEKYRNKGKLSKTIIGIVGLYIVISGGEIGDIKIPNPIDIYKQIKTVEIEVEEEKLNLEEQKVDLQNKELENYNNKLKVYKEMKESGILDDDIQDCLEELQKYGANLLMGNDEN